MSENQRIQRVFKTDKLNQISRQIYELSNRNEKIMMEGFSDTEVCLLKRFLKQIYQNIEKISVTDTERTKEKKGEIR